MVVENSISKVIYSRTMSQFQSYSPTKKKVLRNLIQKNGLVKRRIVSLCGNSSDASRSICIPLPWYQSVAWTKKGDEALGRLDML